MTAAGAEGGPSPEELWAAGRPLLAGADPQSAAGRSAARCYQRPGSGRPNPSPKGKQPLRPIRLTPNLCNPLGTNEISGFRQPLKSR